jgi:uncharacterized protein (UPF0548 family)
VFRLTRPTAADRDAFLVRQRDGRLSYAEVGASAGPAPPGYTVDHNRIRLGSGELTFHAAVDALLRWRMFDLGWCAIHPGEAPVAVGATVAAVVSHFGFWSMNANRVVYLLDDERAGVRRRGFAYGTLRDHGERGEERFSVEWDRRDDSVWYDLYAFSRPAHPLSRLGRPLARMLQRRFARDSMRAMAAAIGNLADPRP